MKRKNYNKKGIVLFLVCACAVLYGFTVHASVESGESVKGRKLAGINECDRQINRLLGEISGADDAAQKAMKEELQVALDEKMQLEIETDTYAYDEELEASIHSVSAAVADMEIVYKQSPEKLTKMEEKRLDLLKSLCHSYTDQISFCRSNADYKQLLEQFRKEVDEVNREYKPTDLAGRYEALAEASPAPEKEIYWERTEDLGLPKKSNVCLQSGSDHSGLKMIIDSCEVDLHDEGILYFNYSLTKMRTKDLDKDGVKEIVLLFYGGASGTFQNFRVIKFDGQKWAVVPMDWDGEKDSPFVDVKALKNSSVRIAVPKTGYKKTVKLPGNAYLKREGEQAAAGVGYRFFKWSDQGIAVSHQLYVNNVGDAFGEVRQNIQWNEDGTRLVLGKTSYRQK